MRFLLQPVLAILAVLPAFAAPATCRQVVLSGETAAGHEWRQSIGQGWVFRLVPITPAASGYTGWDLVVDREPPASFPDALLLATPPYDSLSEREIGTTFGLRSQDALGWNPRSFHFLTDPAAFSQARQLYWALRSGPHASASGPAARGLLDLAAHSAAGRLRILDARIVPGTGDPASYARNWALQSARTPHTSVASAAPTPLGSLQWIRFEITLWLPANWKAPAALHPQPAPCQ